MAENPSQKPSPDDPEQSLRFVEMAKLLGAEESKDAFDAALSAVTGVRPEPPVPDGKTQSQGQQK